MKINKILTLPVIMGLLTGLFIALFLSGKIISFPQGTHSGGVIAATGVAIIILGMVSIGFLLSIFIPFIKKNINRK